MFVRELPYYDIQDKFLINLFFRQPTFTVSITGDGLSAEEEKGEL
jgi:hypothetical protein